MGMLGMKFNSEEMERMLEGCLRPGETLRAAAYCAFQQTGFFASNRAVQAGYIGLTSGNRILGIRCSLLDTVQFSFETGFLEHIRIRKLLFGARRVDLEGPEGKLRFVINPKIAGPKFPEQFENFQKILEVLEAREAQLR